MITWQKRRFKKHWAKLSSKNNKKPGRKPIRKEIQDLITQMVIENNWGAPKILSELIKLGYDDVSQSTVSRYTRKIKANDPDKRKKQQSWKTFLKNHHNVIAAMDFFVIPTVNFKTLYVFFIIDHKKRKIVLFNVTENPISKWVKIQLRDAFSFDSIPKYLIFDRDKIFSSEVKQFIKDMGIKPKIISYQAHWQNGIAERYVLSIRNEILNHVIIFNSNHLCRLIREYLEYYTNDRNHLALNRDSPNGREVQKRPSESAKVIALPRLGGLQHKYEWREAA